MEKHEKDYVFSILLIFEIEKAYKRLCVFKASMGANVGFAIYIQVEVAVAHATGAPASCSTSAPAQRRAWGGTAGLAS